MLKINVKIRGEQNIKFLNKTGSGRVLCWTILLCQEKGSSGNAGPILPRWALLEPEKQGKAPGHFLCHLFCPRKVLPKLPSRFILLHTLLNYLNSQENCSPEWLCRLVHLALQMRIPEIRWSYLPTTTQPSKWQNQDAVTQDSQLLYFFYFIISE